MLSIVFLTDTQITWKKKIEELLIDLIDNLWFDDPLPYFQGLTPNQIILADRGEWLYTQLAELHSILINNPANLYYNLEH